METNVVRMTLCKKKKKLEQQRTVKGSIIPKYPDYESTRPLRKVVAFFIFSFSVNEVTAEKAVSMYVNPLTIA